MTDMYLDNNAHNMTRGVNMHQCIVILGPAIRVLYRDTYRDAASDTLRYVRTYMYVSGYKSRYTAIAFVLAENHDMYRIPYRYIP